MYGSEVNVILGKFVLSIVLIQHSGYLSDIFAALCPQIKNCMWKQKYCMKYPPYPKSSNLFVILKYLKSLKIWPELWIRVDLRIADELERDEDERQDGFWHRRRRLQRLLDHRRHASVHQVSHVCVVVARHLVKYKLSIVKKKTFIILSLAWNNSEFRLINPTLSQETQFH